MAVLQALQLSKSFPDNELFHDLTFSLERHERVGLVGINGSGKTTLLRILAGLEPPDSGRIQFSKGSLTGLMRQDPDPRQDAAMIIESSTDPAGAALLYQTGLPVMPLDQPDRLSGGERTRLALSRCLAAGYDILLLDEPTANLDFDGIRQTIQLINTYPGSLVIVSHDRYFLDETVSRIIELEHGVLTSYEGNYTDYRAEKKHQYEASLHRYQSSVREESRLEASIQVIQQRAEKSHRLSTAKDSSGLKMGLKEGKRVRARKLDRQAKNDIRRLERQRQGREAKPKAERRLQFEIASAGPLGHRIIEAADLAKGYQGRRLFTDSRFYVSRGEKVAIFGPNGCGKTTLVRMIQGHEHPDEGTLWLSGSARIFYLNQQTDDLPERQTLSEYLLTIVPKLDGHVRAVIDQIGFSQSQLEQRLGSLSMGEQMKVRLLEAILSQSDLLILDEPTNFLDLHARETLEDALTDYGGTVLIVSHDLYLLRQICDKVLLFEQGKIKRIEDSFAEYSDKRMLNPDDRMSPLLAPH